MGKHLLEYRSRMHTLLTLNGRKKSKLNWWPLWRDTLLRVLQEHGGYIDGSLHAAHWYWETPRIGIMFHDNGTMNGHVTLRWILQFSAGWEIDFCQWLSRNLQSIPTLTKTKHRMRRSCTSLNVTNAPCLVHLLHKRRCYCVRYQAKFVIWSGASQCFLRIIWIFSTCMPKWATMSAQKCSSNSKTHQILCVCN